MHEYSLVDALVKRAAAEAAAHGAAAVVRRVAVTVGELSGVEPELLRTAWELCRPGTACAAAALDLVEVPARWSCPRCGEHVGENEALRCRRCNEPARLEPGGDALLVESIELEVP